MEKITPTARREFSFPSPIDVHRERSDEDNKEETDENPTALQSIKLYTRLLACESTQRFNDSPSELRGESD
jgi:hypothetical protein